MKLRTVAICALATCCLTWLGHTSSGRGGSRTPKAGKGPAVFETAYRTDGSPSNVAPAGVEPATTRLRAGSSAELSYGAMRM
jgi:hypothetical protein